MPRPGRIIRWHWRFVHNTCQQDKEMTGVCTLFISYACFFETLNYTCWKPKLTINLSISTKWLAPWETVSFVSLRPSMFPKAKAKETLRLMGNKTHCFPWGQSLSDYYSHTRLEYKTRQFSRKFTYEKHILEHLPRGKFLFFLSNSFIKFGTWSVVSSTGPLGATIGWVRRVFANLRCHSGVSGDCSRFSGCIRVGDISLRFLLSVNSLFHRVTTDVLGSFSLLEVCTPLTTRCFRFSASSLFQAGTAGSFEVWVWCGWSANRKWILHVTLDTWPHDLALRLRLHGRGFQSKRFHDLETASKTTRFQRVYNEPIQPFMSRRSRSQAFALRQLDLGSSKESISMSLLPFRWTVLIHHTSCKNCLFPP